MDFRELLLTAGVTPLVADELLRLYEQAGNDGTAAALQALSVAEEPEAAKREARLAWWTGDHIPAEFKRLLDARTEGTDELDEDAEDEDGVSVPEVVQVWDENLQRFAAAGAVGSDLAQAMLGRAWEAACGERLPPREAWPALLEDETLPAQPLHILKSYMAALVEEASSDD